ncbi:MAG: isoprenylcysteine carboxylmethyltransferase family protein [Actinomycetia bacterium]|nr:isoprenylcysteine carboxylmethyltransferase family protein [Actinomycetes bacterium]MCP5033812.1 isoprenylcysteine carboxylmethyltransferase family protein [Actinomycetes bacterium]
MKQILPPKLVLILLIVMVPLGLVAPVLEIPPGPWRLVGLVPALIGAVLTLKGGALFARADTNIKTFDDPDVLVSTGLFRRTRNPMYLGFILLLVGVALLVGGLTAWVGPVGFFVAADRWYIPFEEKRMIETFGTEYDGYRSRVPRWVGRQSLVGALP